MARFFQPLRDKLEAILKLDLDTVALEISKQKGFQRLVIELNTEGQPTSQLFKLGEDSLGRPLKGKTILKDGDYTPFTVKEKRKKGQPTDRPTLKDTGGFYMSFRVIPFVGGFRIEADPIKDNTNLFEELGEDIVGLNDENLQIITDVYKEAIQEKVNKRLK